jgi:hypothetical protein
MRVVTKKRHPRKSVAGVTVPMKTNDVCVRTLSAGQTGVGSAENRAVPPGSMRASLNQEARLLSKAGLELNETRYKEEVDVTCISIVTMYVS